MQETVEQLLRDLYDEGVTSPLGAAGDARRIMLADQRNGVTYDKEPPTAQEIAEYFKGFESGEA